MAPLVAFIPLIAAGIGAATTGIALAKGAGGGPAPKAPTVAQQNTDVGKASQAAAIAQANALTQRRGMASTILTSPLGTGQSQTLG